MHSGARLSVDALCVVQLALTIAVLVMDRRQSGRLRYSMRWLKTIQ